MKKSLIFILFLLGGISAAAAQGYYHYQRASLFEVLPVKSTDIVFLGNSITNGCEWHELLDNPNVRNRGISGDKTTDLLKRLDPIIAGKPAKLFLMIGINDLNSGASVDQTAKNIQSILERFRRETPGTRIYIQSVLPVDASVMEWLPDSNKKVLELNDILKNICNEAGFTYIDLHSSMVNESRRLSSELSNDGLHLMGNAYLLWGKAVSGYVKE